MGPKLPRPGAEIDAVYTRTFASPPVMLAVARGNRGVSMAVQGAPS
jgi:hypothetical protein